MATLAFTAVAAVFLLVVESSATQEAQEVRIMLDGATATHTYDGHGALSAGASSRLLWDYQEPQRTQILDFLFNKSFGASIHTLKVEIGGDAQSTDGTEPSHMHARDDLSCTRGYELWLVQQAKARNPDVQVYGLSWGVPAWIGNGTFYSADNVAYQTAWVSCMRQETGFGVDFLGLWNERPQPQSADYILALRAALDASGAAATELIVMDGGFDDAEVAWAQNDTTFRAAVHGAGLHYPCVAPHPEVQALGWTFWASEDYSQQPAWDDGGSLWAQALSLNYVLSNMTATIAWSLIWSANLNLVCADAATDSGPGLMLAFTPWSGSYNVSAPAWITAHWTQFTAPGWRFLSVAGGGSGLLPPPNVSSSAGTEVGGSYVTLIPPASAPAAGFTIIVETTQGHHCAAAPPRVRAVYNLTFQTAAAMPPPGTPLYVWTTTASAFFQPSPGSVIGADGSFTVAVAADAVVTVSTVATARHGSFADPVPPPAPFPLPYAEDFSGYAYDGMARYLSDQGGSWAVRNGSLVQVAGADPGPNGWFPNPQPLTMLGPADLAPDVTARATVRFDAAPPGGAPASPGSGDGALSPLGIPNGMAYVTACKAGVPAEVFTFDRATGLISSSWGGGPGCLTTCGCEANCLQFFTCLSGGCGSPGQSYSWSLNASSGALLNAAYPGAGALTYLPAAGALSMAPFTGSAGQVWAYDAPGGVFSLPALGLCLSQAPVAANRTFAQLCVRASGAWPWTAPMPGYCLQVDGNGTWALAAGAAAPLATGRLAAGFDPRAPHVLSVTAVGAAITAALDGAVLADAVQDASFAAGNVALGSGWHAVAFDDVSVSPAPSGQPAEK